MPTTADVRHARILAMAAFEDGRVPDAEHALSTLADTLTPPATPQLALALFQVLMDRATVRRIANRWDDALADLDHCEELLSGMGALNRTLLGWSIPHARARLIASPDYDRCDLEAALRSAEAARAAGADAAFVDELESDLAMRRRDWDTASALALRAADGIERKGWRVGAAACRLRALTACLEAGDASGARELLDPVLHVFDERAAPDHRARALLAEARVLSAEGDHDRAWQVTLDALDLLDSLIRRFTLPGEQQRFLQGRLEDYARAFDVALAAGDDAGTARAWSIAERSKSFYLCQLLAASDVALFDGVDPALVEQLRMAEAQVDVLEARLSRLGRDVAEGDSGDALRDALHTALHDKQYALDAIMRANPRWAAVSQPGATDVTALFEALPAGWVPLSFYWREKPGADPVLHVFWSVQGRVRGQSIAWSPDEIARLAAFRDTLAGRLTAFADVFPDSLADRILPAAIRDEFPAGSRLLISAHRHLELLPLHAMTVGDEPLLAHHPVQYLPTMALLALRRPAAVARDVLLLGCCVNAFGDPPLADVAAELDALEAAWCGDGRTSVTRCLIDGDDTLEMRAPPQSDWQRFRVLHLACHGTFPESHPFDAALRLGASALRASELFDVRLDAAAVSLSACAVGRRARSHDALPVVGDEWLGLLMPLLFAGARSVVASLWDAESATAVRIMTDFHRALARGDDRADALRDAVLASRDDFLPPHWANWYLAGVPD